MARRVFIKAVVEFDAEGRMRPLSITWEDGRVFAVDKVTDVRGAVSMKTGGRCMRYACVIRNRQKYLFYEEPRWYIEAKN